MDDKFKERVEGVIEKIRPYLRMDGGDVELVDISDDGKIVKVRLTGACGHCPGAIYTLKMGIEQYLKDEIPEIQSVEAV